MRREAVRWLILADDLTGAADTGAAFRREGCGVRLSLAASGFEGERRVIAVDADLRERPDDPGGVLPVVRSVLRERDPARRLYVKIDSTLRGPIRSLLAAVGACASHEAGAMGPPSLLVCPAFPAQDRITRNGVQYVHGQPVAFQGMGARRGSRLPDLFGEAGGRVVLLSAARAREGSPEAADEGCVVFIADAETEEDLDALAAWAMDHPGLICVGSAGLAGALARRAPSSDPAPRLPKVTALSLLSGSANPRSRVQCAALIAALSCQRPEERSGWLEGEGRLPLPEESGSVRILAAPAPSSGETDHRIAERIAGAALTGGSHERNGWLVTGGETARALLRAAGVTRLALGGEVAPGIPWAVAENGALSGQPVVTKAGGFGEDDIWLKAARLLTGSL